MSRIGFVLLVTVALLTPGCGANYGGSGGGVAPSITSLMPNMMKPGGPAFTLTVNGTGFGMDSVVFWNGAALPSSYATGTMVTAQVSAMDIMNAGMFPVYVRSGGKNSNMIDFTVQ